VAAALALLGKDDARYAEKQRKAYGQDGAVEALAKGEALVRKAQAAGTLDNLPAWASFLHPDGGDKHT
jgi:hypothetical protein